VRVRIGRGGVRFRGRAAWGAVLSGVMQRGGLVVPPGDSSALVDPLSRPFSGVVLAA
jgi:hypothetical protein